MNRAEIVERESLINLQKAISHLINARLSDDEVQRSKARNMAEACAADACTFIQELRRLEEA